MGDDLTFAQGFVDETTETLRSFFSQDHRPSHDVIVDVMTHVQRGAKKLHARGIYQSAQSVLASLHAVPSCEAATDGRLLALNKLIAQYAEGLAEISEPEIAETVPDEITPEPVLETRELPIILGEADAPPQSDEAAYASAKATLTELLPHADGPDAAKLINLMEVSDPANPRPEREFPLESVMRDVVQDALGIARICAKTISISYDVGETSLTAENLDNLQIRLSQTLRALILETLPSDKVGHIDLTVQGREICLTAQGPSPQFTPRVTRKVLSDDHTHLYLSLIEETVKVVEPAPRRMITDETEDELRAKLENLMDPQNLADAMSDASVLAEVSQ